MKRVALSLGVLAVVAMLASSAAAQYGYSPYYSPYSGGYYPQARHARHHDDLEHRAYHRELDHRAAHRYPMTYWQHDALHDDLDHGAFHDHLEHRRAHATGAYYYPYGYRYYSYPAPHYRSGFSFYFGR